MTNLWAGPDEQQHADEVEAIARQIASAARVPGLSIAVATPAKVLCACAVGYADLTARRRALPGDQYLWFPMTKIATATAAMRLHVNGLLDLDAPIETYLPAYRPHPQHGHPTMRQLLTHSAGLANPPPVRWVRPEHRSADPAWLTRIVRKHGRPTKAVGARAAYSNIGYLLAGEVIEAVTGRPVEENVHDLVLRPLGMQATGYSYFPVAPRAVGYVRLPAMMRPMLARALPEGIVGPGAGRYISFNPFLVNGPAYGGLIGTAADAVKLAAAHAASAADPHSMLGQRDIEEMRTIIVPGRRFDHGIGWFRRPADAQRRPAFVEHYGTGGGFWNAMRTYPDHRLAMVAMANTTAAWGVDVLFTRLVELPWD